jgi:peroxiredoxin
MIRMVQDLAAALFAVAGLAGLGCVEAVPASDASSARTVWERPGLAGAVRPEMGRPQPGDRAPDFDLPIAGGGSLRLSSLSGSWVVMHFTATWCPFCDAEVDHLGELADAYRSQRVKVVLIDLKEDVQGFATYAKARVPANVTALYDATGETALRFVPPGAQPSFTDRAQVMFDTTLIVDPEGIIRLFLLPDSAHFDPTFKGVRGELTRLLGVKAAPLQVSTAAPPPMTPGSDADLVVHVAVAPGYHVMSDHPTKPSYIATDVRIEAPDGVTVGPRHYPAPVDFSLGERFIATFEGQVDVMVPLHAEAAAAPGERVVRGSIRYQACTRGLCLMPETLPFSSRVHIREAQAR